MSSSSPDINFLCNMYLEKEMKDQAIDRVFHTAVKGTGLMYLSPYRWIHGSPQANFCKLMKQQTADMEAQVQREHIANQAKRFIDLVKTREQPKFYNMLKEQAAESKALLQKANSLAQSASNIVMKVNNFLPECLSAQSLDNIVAAFKVFEGYTSNVDQQLQGNMERKMLNNIAYPLEVQGSIDPEALTIKGLSSNLQQSMFHTLGKGLQVAVIQGAKNAVRLMTTEPMTEKEFQQKFAAKAKEISESSCQAVLDQKQADINVGPGKTQEQTVLESKASEKTIATHPHPPTTTTAATTTTTTTPPPPNNNDNNNHSNSTKTMNIQQNNIRKLTELKSDLGRNEKEREKVKLQHENAVQELKRVDRAIKAAKSDLDETLNLQENKEAEQKAIEELLQQQEQHDNEEAKQKQSDEKSQQQDQHQQQQEQQQEQEQEQQQERQQEQQEEQKRVEEEQKRVEEEQKRVEEEQKRVEEEQKRVEEEQRQKEEEEEKRQRLLEEIAQLEQRIMEIEKKIDEIEKEIHQLEQEIKELQDKCEELKSALEKFNEELEKLNAEIEQKNAQIKQLDDQVSQCEEQVAAAQQELAKALAALAAAYAQSPFNFAAVASALQQVASAVQKLSQAKNKLSRKRQERSQAISERESLQARQEEKSSEVEQTTANINQVNTKIEQKAEKVKQLLATRERLEEERQQYKRELADKRQRNHGLRLSGLDVHTLQQRKISVAAEIKELNHRIDSKSQVVVDYEAKYTQIHLQKTDASKRYNEMSSMIKQQQKRLRKQLQQRQQQLQREQKQNRARQLRKN